MIFSPSADILRFMRKTAFTFMVVAVGILPAPVAFSQTDDPLEAFLMEEEESMEHQTPEERFQDYLDAIILERQAFQKALTGMSQFLNSIENNEVRLSDVNRMKTQLSDASELLSQNDMALSFKEDGIFDSIESLKQCMETASSQTETSQ